MLFYRSTVGGKHTDATATLRGLYSSPKGVGCWIIGGGPSILTLPPETLAAINASPAPKFAINLAGRGPDSSGWLIKPTLWTSFDPTTSFTPSIFNDPTITKFVRKGREMDLVPGSPTKLCSCPSTFFIGRQGTVDFEDFLPTDRVNDSRDSFIQALSIGYLLGFREFYLVGVDMKIVPSDAQLEAWGVGRTVMWKEGAKEPVQSDLLKHIVETAAKAQKKTKEAIIKEGEAVEREGQYAFCERKDLGAALHADMHYWERVQELRLAAPFLVDAGVSLLQTNFDSRLNEAVCDAVYEAEISSILDTLSESVGCPKNETTVGKYTGKPKDYIPVYQRDVKPYRWPEQAKKADPQKQALKQEVAEMLERRVMG